MTITIREATLEDAKLLANLNCAVQEPHLKERPESYKPFIQDNPELIAIYTERLADENCFSLIAGENDTAVGYVQCFVRKQPYNPFVYSKIDCHIDQIAVLESHQGQGIGKKLMREAMKIGQERGAEVYTLGVVAFNQGAIRFYERLGFEIKSHRMSLRVTGNDNQ